eukprot:736133-Karenia_brevis.AAC.1
MAFQIIGREEVQLQAKVAKERATRPESESDLSCSDGNGLSCPSSEVDSIMSPAEDSAEDVKEETVHEEPGESSDTDEVGRAAP